MNLPASPKRSIDTAAYESELSYQNTIQRMSLELCELKKFKEEDSPYKEESTIKEDIYDTDEGARISEYGRRANLFPWTWTNSNFNSENF